MAVMSWLMIAFSLVFLNKLHSQSDTTVFDFTRFDARDPNLIFQGDALEVNGYISLTTFSVGRVLYSPPIRLWDRAGRRQANFQTVFRSKICCALEENLLNGISFFIAPVDSTIPTASTAGGNMGLYDNSSGTSPVPTFAVELDYFPNSWDPNYRHLGINIDSRNSVAFERWQWETPGITGYPWSIVETRITYDARLRLISVIANATKFLSPMELLIGKVEYTYDLKTLLPEWVQIGFSSSTEVGQAVLIGNQDMLSWSFISFLVPDDEASH